MGKWNETGNAHVTTDKVFVLDLLHFFFYFFCMYRTVKYVFTALHCIIVLLYTVELTEIKLHWNWHYAQYLKSAHTRAISSYRATLYSWCLCLSPSSLGLGPVQVIQDRLFSTSAAYSRLLVSGEGLSHTASRDRWRHLDSRTGLWRMFIREASRVHEIRRLICTWNTLYFRGG